MPQVVDSQGNELRVGDRVRAVKSGNEGTIRRWVRNRELGRVPRVKFDRYAFSSIHDPVDLLLIPEEEQ